MQNIMDRLIANQNRSSTMKNYVAIWRSFNKFLIRLDSKPDSWEQRVSYFAAFLVEEKKVQSATLKSYISAIKHILRCDRYKWRDEEIWLNALVKSCKLVNDVIYTHFPIHFKLLEIILFEVGRILGGSQPFLECLYKAMFALSYYGLMRISEVTDGPHPIKAKDIHIADNKDKIKIILYSSKTHDVSQRPQEIKISSSECTGKHNKRFFCPFQLLRTYMRCRGSHSMEAEQFFVFADKTPVKQQHAREFFKDIIKSLNLNPDCYNFQSMHICRATDLLKFGFNIETIKRLGRWRSNAVYKYLRSF